MKQTFLSLFLFLSLWGCASLGKPPVKVSPYTKQFFQPTTKIEVLKEAPPEGPFIEIAELSIRIKKPGSDRALNHLSDAAKQLGADALILKGERKIRSIDLPETSRAFDPMYKLPEKALYAVAIKYKSTGPEPPTQQNRSPRPKAETASGFKAIAQFSGKVVAVSEGDVIKVMFSRVPVKVRLAEIDCPEKTQAYGNEAKEFTTDLVFGKVVVVRVKEIDRFGANVGEVILDDGKHLNRELLKAGLAWWDRKNSGDLMLGRIEKAARRKKLGLWRDPDPVPPWTLRRP